MNYDILKNKILDISLDHDEMIEFFKKYSVKGLPMYKDELEAMVVPYNIPERHVDDIRIIQENNIVIIKFPKYEAVNGWSILWRTVGYSDYTSVTIGEVRINGHVITNETFENYIEMLLYENTISIHFKDTEEAQNSTNAIYYKIKSTHSDDYFYNKECNRIKKVYGK